jgi:hypothetical protein
VANIRTRKLTKGGSSHTITWRDPETGHQTRTFSDKDYGPGEALNRALELKAFLDANGNTYKLAAKAKVRKDSTAPTVYEVVVRHIDLLRKPQPGTIAKYRNMAAGHIADSDLGKTPVDKVNEAAVIDWLDQLKVLQGANQKVGEPLSRKSKQNVHALLSAAFVTAMDAETMTRNPAKGVAEADLNEAREAVYLSPEDLVCSPNASIRTTRCSSGSRAAPASDTRKPRHSAGATSPSATAGPQCASAGHGSQRAKAKRSDRPRPRRPTAP